MPAEQILAKRPSVTRAALIALTAGLSIGASVAHAQVVDSGLLATPINVPNTVAGVYLNLATGATGATAGATPGWDFNPWGSTTAPAGLALFWPAPAAQHGAVATGTVVDNLAVGATISAASNFSTTGGAANFANIRAGGTVYVGIRFVNETGGTQHYGYVQMTTTAPSGFPAQIVRYVFQATPNTAITVTAPGGGATPPVFGYTPAAGSTVTGTGGDLVGSTANFSITPSIATAGTGTGAAATTTLTCTAPTAPFAGFGQTVTAIGTGAISGGPLAGTCTRGTAAVTQTLTCSENRGGTATARTWTLNCPAGTIPSVPVNATSAWSLIALMLALFGFAAVAVRRQG